MVSGEIYEAPATPVPTPAPTQLGNITGAVALDLSQNNDQHGNVNGNVTFSIGTDRSTPGWWTLALTSTTGGFSVSWPLSIKNNSMFWNGSANNSQTFHFYFDGTNHHFVAQS